MEYDNDSGWNMNLAYLQRLDRRLDEADTAANEYDLWRWHAALYTIYTNIHWKIKKSEHREEIENDVKNKLDIIHESLKDLLRSNPETKQKRAEIRTKAAEKLRAVQITLYDFIVENKIVDIEPAYSNWKTKLKTELDIQ